MVFSYYLLKPFYSSMWRILNLINKRREIVFYCHTPVDMQNWLPVQKHLKRIRIVTDKPTSYHYLKEQGYRPGPLPAFPKAVIMCRVAAHKFPSSKVMKIGMNHGAYHFKRFSSAQHYAPFELFLFSSQANLDKAREVGIKCGKIGGYPKLDPWLKREIEPVSRKKSGKPVILFTSTYKSSGMSAIDRWIKHLPRLAETYEVYVSLHPWMDKEYVERITQMPGLHYVADRPLPYIAMADLVVVDSSSVIAECCALDKPLISWELPDTPRSVPEITRVLKEASIRIKDIDELEAAIGRALAKPEEFHQARMQASSIFFDALDGEAGKRSAAEILKLLPELTP